MILRRDTFVTSAVVGTKTRDTWWGTSATSAGKNRNSSARTARTRPSTKTACRIITSSYIPIKQTREKSIKTLTCWILLNYNFCFNRNSFLPACNVPQKYCTLHSCTRFTKLTYLEYSKSVFNFVQFHLVSFMSFWSIKHLNLFHLKGILSYLKKKCNLSSKEFINIMYILLQILFSVLLSFLKPMRVLTICLFI